MGRLKTMRRNVPKGISIGMMTLLSDKRRDQRSAAVAVTCQAYCAYYKGEDGEDGCGGLAAIKRGLASGRVAVDHIKLLVDVPPGPARRDRVLTDNMCARCSYLAGGCDFMSPSPPPDVTPCGGYRLLLALLDKGALTEDEVEAAAQDAGRRTQDAQ